VLKHLNADRAIEFAFHVWQSLCIVDVARNYAHIFEAFLGTSTFNKGTLGSAIGKGCDLAIREMFGAPKSK
jgi:hypothetical protein